jgi:predicted SAM-dependent methyltransferase
MFGLARRLLNGGGREAVSRLYSELRLQRAHNRGAKVARQRYAGQRGLKLHLGSGAVSRPGWVNIDFKPQADLGLDVREPWPFDDGSADEVYSEHFFEHLGYPDEVGHYLREAMRVLRPSGLLTIGVPDSEVMMRDYITPDPVLRETVKRWHPAWCDTSMHSVNYVFRQGEMPNGEGHRYAYDEQTLAKVVRDAGFLNVRRRGFDPAADSDPERGKYTVYIVADRP